MQSMGLFLEAQEQCSRGVQEDFAFSGESYGQRLKFLRIDNGNEYISNTFHDFCDEKDIKQELTMPNNPSQNGVTK